MSVTPEEQKQFEDKKAADASFARATDLKNQIAYWQRQYASDPVSYSTAPTTIDGLQRELNGIPNYLKW